MLELWHVTTHDHEFIEVLPAGIENDWEAISIIARRWHCSSDIDRFPTRLDPRNIPESVREDFKNLPSTVLSQLNQG